MLFCFIVRRRQPISTRSDPLFPYTALVRAHFGRLCRCGLSQAVGHGDSLDKKNDLKSVSLAEAPASGFGADAGPAMSSAVAATPRPGRVLDKVALPHRFGPSHPAAPTVTPHALPRQIRISEASRLGEECVDQGRTPW